MSRVKLTTRSVANFTGDAYKDSWLWDTQILGFGLKVSKAGHRTFVYKFRSNEGRQRKRKIGDANSMRMEDAWIEALKLQTKHAMGEEIVRNRYLHDGEDGLVDRAPHPGRVWNKIPDNVRKDILDMALDIPELSPRKLAVRFTDTQGYFVSESSVYRLLKAHDLISSPAFIVMKAASEFKDKTTAINQMSLSALLRIACRAAGRQTLPTSRLSDGAGCIYRRCWMTSHATS